MRLQTLWQASGTLGRAGLPAPLRRLYDGELSFPAPPRERPYVVSNFVSTLDGVVSYGLRGQSGGGTISGGDAGDRFGMGLLRAAADAVIVGARTLREAGPRALWEPGYTYPAAAAAFRVWRRSRGLPPSPLLVVMTRSGRVDFTSAVFHAPGARVLLLAPAVGPAPAAEAAARRRAQVEWRALPGGGSAAVVAALLRLLRRQYGVRLLLHEGGPTLLGEFFAAAAVDEVFLSLAPTLAGRSAAAPRPGMIAALAFAPAHAPRLRLRSLKTSGKLLLLRYRVAHQA